MKRKEKKKLSFPLRLLIVLIILGATFGSMEILANSDDSSELNSTELNTTVNETEVETQELITETQEDILETQATTEEPEDFAESLIVDNDAMSVYYVGAQDASSLGIFYVTLKVENKTDSVIFVNLENASVDGETIPLITTGVPLVIQPGNSGRTGFIFSMVNLSISSMDEAEKATFQVVVRNNDTFAEISRSEMVTVELH